MRRALAIGIEFLAYLGLWFLFVGKLVFAELVIGIVCAALATVASQVVFQARLAKLVGNPQLWLEAWHLPWTVVKDTGLVLAVLAKHVLGIAPAKSLLRAVEFDPGEEDEPQDATRRALATGYSTVSPNVIVVGIDRERRFLLFHQLERDEVSALTKHLGARVPEGAE